MKFLDQNGVKTLWEKMKELAADGGVGQRK